MTFRSQATPHTTYDVGGGATTVGGGPAPNPYVFQYSNGGALTFENPLTDVFVRNSTINIEGGKGHDAPAGIVAIRGAASIYDNTVTFHTTGGRRGPYSPFLVGLDDAGKGGQVRFEDSTNAGGATIVNDGVYEFRSGTGGQTVFANSSDAGVADIHNHGAAFRKGGGGATQFFNTSDASYATITNHADATFIYSVMSAQTVFFDSSNAYHATIENESGSSILNAPGRTEFRNNSSAANSTINNRGNPAFGGGAGGLTQFYDSATAATATINLYEGYDKSGRTDFYNNSTAANSHIFFEATNPPGGSSNGGGGNLIFHDNSTAADALITLKTQACCNGIQFKDSATAANATIVQEDNSGSITFTENATAGSASRGSPPLRSVKTMRSAFSISRMRPMRSSRWPIGPGSDSRTARRPASRKSKSPAPLRPAPTSRRAIFQFELDGR